MPATAQAPDKPRRSRITAACGVCRAKRQKCSGERPVCDQCKMHNEECWWSETKKRGPAKDYLRALQDRLQDTEKLLLGVLGRLSDAELLEILQREPANGNGPSHQSWTSSMSGSDYWASHPLNRLDGVRMWEMQRRTGATSTKQGRASSTLDNSGVGSATRLQSDMIMDPALESSPLDTMSMTGSVTTEHKDVLNEQYPSAPQRNGSWTAPEAVMARSSSRRYSQETREAGEALFSISNHLRTASQHSQLPQNQWTQQQHQQQSESGSSVTPQAAGSQFPKHLFW